MLIERPPSWPATIGPASCRLGDRGRRPRPRIARRLGRGQPSRTHRRGPTTYPGIGDGLAGTVEVRWADDLKHDPAVAAQVAEIGHRSADRFIGDNPKRRIGLQPTESRGARSDRRVLEVAITHRLLQSDARIDGYRRPVDEPIHVHNPVAGLGSIEIAEIDEIGNIPDPEDNPRFMRGRRPAQDRVGC